jgi:hypothetical protein
MGRDRSQPQDALVSLGAAQLADEPVRLSTEPDSDGLMYCDNLWSTLLRHLGGVQKDERAKRLAALSGNDVSLLRSAAAHLRGQPETPERELALLLVDLAVLRALQSASQ